MACYGLCVLELTGVCRRVWTLPCCPRWRESSQRRCEWAGPCGRAGSYCSVRRQEWAAARELVRSEKLRERGVVYLDREEAEVTEQRWKVYGDPVSGWAGNVNRDD